MNEAWRVGVPFGLALFILSLLGTVPYFVTAIPDPALTVITDALSIIAFLALLEAGRRVGRSAGAGFGALAGGIAGFLSALAGILQHALLSAAPGYERLVTDEFGHRIYLASTIGAGGAAAMVGIFGGVLAGTILGAVLGILGGLIGSIGRPHAPIGDDPT